MPRPARLLPLALSAVALRIGCDGKDDELPNAPCSGESDHVDPQVDVGCFCDHTTSPADLNTEHYREVETCGPDDFPGGALCCATQNLEGTEACACLHIRCARDDDCVCGPGASGATVDRCEPEAGEVCCQAPDGTCTCQRDDGGTICAPEDEVVDACTADQVQAGCVAGFAEVESCNLQDDTEG